MGITKRYGRGSSNVFFLMHNPIISILDPPVFLRLSCVQLIFCSDDTLCSSSALTGRNIVQGFGYLLVTFDARALKMKSLRS